MAKTKTGSYVWEGTNKRGQKIQGEMIGENAAIIKAQLRKQGVVPGKIKRKSEGFFGINLNSGKKIGNADITLFMRQLATMTKSGVPLVQGLEIVADGLENPNMQKLVLGIKDQVAAGNDFASCLTEYPDQFDKLTCSLIASGEQSGALETMLDRVAIYKEKTELLKQKIKKATKYPMIVMIIAAIVTSILLLKVVPTFQEMFSSMGANLPAPTLALIAMSEFMQAYWYILLGSIIGGVILLKHAIKTSPAVAEQKDILVLKLPIIGSIMKKAVVARFARVLSTTFSAGVPLVEALESVAGAADNIIYKRAILKVRDDVSSGIQLNSSMRSTGVFPNMVVQMVAIGEESGALDAMLAKVAEYFEQEVDNEVDGLTAMIEPFVMAFLGVVVGGMLIAMYLPIFKLGDTV